MADKLWNAKYWADRIEETREEVAPILQKMAFNYHSTDKLTVEEQYKLQSCLEAYASYSRLLSEDMAQPDPKPLPFWKRILR